MGSAPGEWIGEKEALLFTHLTDDVHLCSRLRLRCSGWSQVGVQTHLLTIRTSRAHDMCLTMARVALLLFLLLRLLLLSLLLPPLLLLSLLCDGVGIVALLVEHRLGAPTMLAHPEQREAETSEVDEREGRVTSLRTRCWSSPPVRWQVTAALGAAATCLTHRCEQRRKVSRGRTHQRRKRSERASCHTLEIASPRSALALIRVRCGALQLLRQLTRSQLQPNQRAAGTQMAAARTTRCGCGTRGDAHQLSLLSVSFLYLLLCVSACARRARLVSSSAQRSLGRCACS